MNWQMIVLLKNYDKINYMLRLFSVKKVLTGKVKYS